MPVAHVLVIEDDSTVAEVGQSYLARDGHEASWLSDGTRASAYLRSARAKDIDLVVLDLMLPGISGLELCEQIRSDLPNLPIIMLTALAEEQDRVVGLSQGADDYVTKPFSPRELVLRIESVLRRSRMTSTTPPAVLTVGPVTIDTGARSATLRDATTGAEETLVLTVREMDVLIHLMLHRGQAFTREQLMLEVWGWSYGDRSTVTVHVRRIRQKIEQDPSRPRILQTVWGVGYRMDAG